MKKTVITLIKAAILIAIFYYVGRIFYNNWQEIKDYPWHINYTYLAISIGLLSFGLIMVVGCWHLILIALGIRIPILKNAKIWFLSQLGRYLPGYVWTFIGRVAFMTEEGVSRNKGILCVYIEAISGLLAGILVSIIFLLTSSNHFDGINLPLIIISLIGGIIFLHPKVLEVALNTVFSLIGREKVKIKYSFGKILVVNACYMLYWFVINLSLYFLVKSIYEVDASQFAALSFAFTASWLIGYIAPFSPAGLGVREGVLIFFLKQILPESISAVISVSTRLWSIAGEFGTLAIVLLAFKLFYKEKKGGEDGA